MALVLGTNCGFVTSAPTDDPSGDATVNMDTMCNAQKDTSPATAAKVTEIGWWSNNATEESNFEVGLYSDAGAGEPELRLQVDDTNAKGTTAGWKKVTVNWTISPSTIYWLAVQLDDTSTNTVIDRANAGGTDAYAQLNAQTSLPSDWGSSYYKNATRLFAIYAVWQAASPPPAPEVDNYPVQIGSPQLRKQDTLSQRAWIKGVPR